MSQNLSAEYGIPPEGFRMPAETRLGRVKLQVSDLERSSDFYRTVLGLEVGASSAGSALFGSADGLSLVELRAGARSPRNAARPRLGLYHFAILLPDRAALGSFVTHLTALGLRFGASDHLVSEALYLQDPDGLGIEVYADRPRSTWATRGRELVMSSDPLDLRSLTAAASDRWLGMPEGTRVGHVHLHVGDLSAADRFYHGAMGFARVVWSYPGALFLSAGGYHHHLGLNTWAGPGAAAPRSEEPRLLEWEILAPDRGDVENAASSLEAGGYDVSRDPHGWSARDPWGTPVRMRPA